MQIDGFLEQLAKLIRVAAFALTVVRLEAHVPVLFDSHRMLRFPREPVPGRELAHSLDDALRPRRVETGEQVMHGPPVEPPVNLRQLEQCLQLGGEEQPSIDFGVVKGFDPQPVPRQEQFPAALVPYGKGEHAAHPLHARGPVFFVKMDDGLRVGGRVKGVAARQQLLPQVFEVIDLAVEDDPD